jgi:hypothetical protein
MRVCQRRVSYFVAWDFSICLFFFLGFFATPFRVTPVLSFLGSSKWILTCLVLIFNECSILRSSSNCRPSNVSMISSGEAP